MFDDKELEEIKNYIQNSSDISLVAVGCDSNYSSKNTLFTLIVGIHIDGKHGTKIFKKRFKIFRRLGLKEKLWQEVIFATQLALEIFPVVGKRKFSVHLDLNPNENEASNIIIKEAKAMVRAYGFDVKVKPDAHMSTYAANHFVKGKDIKKTIIATKRKI